MKAIILAVLIVAVSAFSINNGVLPPLIHPRDVTRTSRIVGGTQATIGQFPYQCGLYVNGDFMCGCAIITDRWVLTAAHCADRSASEYTIRVGSSILNQGTQYTVSRVIPHEEYGNFVNDIGMIQASTAIALGEYVATIHRRSSNVVTATRCQLSGWGRIYDEGGLSPVLRYIESQTQSTEQCSSGTGISHSGTFCFYNNTGGRGICTGDSGGPAACGGQLQAIANFVVGGCGSGYPDGFANVVWYTNWINRNLALFFDEEVE